MRVCDRHQDVLAVTSVILESTDERVDVCSSCLEAIRAVVYAPPDPIVPKKIGRPRKNLAQAN